MFAWFKQWWKRLQSGIRKPRRLRSRLIGVLGIIILGTMLAMGGMIYYIVYQADVSAWQRLQGEAARNAALTVSAFLKRAEDSLNLVNLLDHDELSTKPEIASSLFHQNDSLLEVVRVDASGHVLANVFQGEEPMLGSLLTIPQSQWFVQARAGKPYYGRVQQSAAGQPYLILAFPAPDGGVVAARLSMDVMWTVVGDIRFGKTGRSFVIDRSGDIIAHTNSRLVLGNATLAGSPELEAVLGSNNLWHGEYTNLEGIRVVASTMQVPGTDWIVFTEVTQEEAYMNSNASLGILVFWVLVLSVLAMLASSWFLEALILRPMDRLQLGAERIGKGDLTYRIEMEGEGEISLVAAAFDRMARQLAGRAEGLAARTNELLTEVEVRKKTEAELHQAHAELESRVVERTAELAHTNSMLKEKISELEQTQQSLQDLFNRYRIVADNTFDWEFWIDADGQFLYTSPSCKRITGYEREDFLREPGLLLQIILPDDLPIWQIHRAEETIGKTSGLIEFRIQRADGSIRWIGHVCQALYNDHGIFIGTRGNNRDISERKQAEDDVRNHAARSEALLRVAARLNAQLDLDTLLRTICQEVAAALHVPAAWINLYDPNQDIFYYASDYNMPLSFKKRYKPLLRALYDEYSSQGSSIIVFPDVQMLTDVPNYELYASLNIRTLTYVSMLRDGQLIGSLSIIFYDEVYFLSQDEQALLKGLADQAAQAIINVSLFKDVQRHLNLEQDLHEIDLAITSVTHMDESLELILRLITHQLGIDAALVLLVNPKSEKLEKVMSCGFQDSTLPIVELKKGESYAGRAWLDSIPIFIPDLSKADFWKDRSLLEAEKFISYYALPLIVKGQVIGVFEVFSRSAFTPDAEWLKLFKTLTTQTAIAINSFKLLEDLEYSNAELVQAYNTTLEGWSRAMDLRDKETEGHTQRVTEIAVRLGRAMGLDELDLLNIHRGALLHDIGKMGIPDTILLKPDLLTAEEWDIMHQHPLYAYELLSPIAYLLPALDIPFCHHEKWDGSGYPRGLSGDEIPLAGRLFAVIDVWDALTSDRPYRRAWAADKARLYIQEQSGKHFDPQIVTAFLKMLDEFSDKE